MSVAARRIAIPRLLEVRASCLDGLARLSADAGFDTTRVCVGSGAGPSVAFADRVVSGLRAAGLDVIEPGALAGGLEQAADLAGRVIAEDVTLLVAVGGGRVIDTVKLAAGRTGTEFISVPTAISHDGISSPVAS